MDRCFAAWEKWVEVYQAFGIPGRKHTLDLQSDTMTFLNLFEMGAIPIAYSYILSGVTGSELVWG